MKMKNYIIGIFILFVGILFALFPNGNPITAMGQRFGHIFIITGVFVIISNIIISKREKKFATDIDSLFRNDNSSYLMNPWKIVNKNDRIFLETDEKFYYYMIIVAILIAGGIIYLVVPMLVNFMPGFIIQTPGTYIMFLSIGIILSIIFIGVAIVTLTKGKITIVDYNRSLILILEREQSKFIDTTQFKSMATFPIEVLNTSRVNEEGYYKIKISTENMTGDITRLKNWIVNEKYILIQSNNSEFIKNLHENLIQKLKNSQ